MARSWLVLVTVLAAAACGGGDDVVGRWTLDVEHALEAVEESSRAFARRQGKDLSDPDVAMQIDMNRDAVRRIEMSVELREDGTGTSILRAPGTTAPETRRFTWSREGSTITTQTTGGRAAGSVERMRFEGGHLWLENDPRLPDVELRLARSRP